MPKSDPLEALINRAMLDGGLRQLRAKIDAKIEELEAAAGYSVGPATPETVDTKPTRALSSKHKTAISKGQRGRWKKQRQDALLPKTPAMPPLPAEPPESVSLSSLAPAGPKKNARKHRDAVQNTPPAAALPAEEPPDSVSLMALASTGQASPK
jgi:hypothetical protein